MSKKSDNDYVFNTSNAYIMFKLQKNCFIGKNTTKWLLNI